MSYVVTVDLNCIIQRKRQVCANQKKFTCNILSEGERERAHAILLACRHLPMPLLTPPGHRARLLAEAKRTLERVGDRRSLQDCQQILLRLSGGTTIAAS